MKQTCLVCGGIMKHLSNQDWLCTECGTEAWMDDDGSLYFDADYLNDNDNISRADGIRMERSRMQMIIYKTNEWKGYGKQNYYWNEYRREGNTVYKYKCHRQKFFDGDENNWETEESLEESWAINDPTMPEWLKQYI